MPKTRATTERKREVASEKLTGLCEDRDKAEELANRKRQRMYGGMLKAFNAGLTYDEIAEIVGLSKIRVSQVLTEQRNGA